MNFIEDMPEKENHFLCRKSTSCPVGFCGMCGADDTCDMCINYDSDLCENCSVPDDVELVE